MRAVFGLVDLDAGEVRWRGEPIAADQRGGSATCQRSGVSTPGCGHEISSSTSGDSAVAPARRVTERRQGLERLGLADRANDRVDALSHGNQQRVQLIAALINEPDLLVLDEPFSGLDPIAIANMSELLREIAAGGATVLFSSHQLDLVEDLCEDVVIIDHGHVVLAGDLDDLRAAVPERFVDIRYLGGPPNWTDLSTASSRRLGRGPRQAACEPRHRPRHSGARCAARQPSSSRSAYQPPTLSELFREAVAA